jgi:hypothetical protein
MRMPDWLWQGSLLILFGIGVQVVHDKIKTQYPDWITTVVNGIRNAAYLGIVFFAVTGHGINYKEPEKITPTNIEDHLQEWLTSAGYAVLPEHDPNGKYFDVSSETLFIRKLTEKRLKLQGNVELSQKQQLALNKMTSVELTRFNHDVAFEAAKLGLHAVIEQGKILIISRDIPITETMNEQDFLDAVKRVEFARIIIPLDKEFGSKK